MFKYTIIAPRPIQTKIQIGNRTIAISGATLAPIRVIKDITSSTQSFIKKASEASHMNLVLPSEEKNGVVD